MCINISFVFKSIDGHCVGEVDLFINAFLLLTAIVIIILNSLVLHSFCNYTDMTEPTYSFIANLAVSDLLIGVFVIYDTVYNILQFKLYIECVLRMGLFITVNLASVMNLAALTLDRLLKITQPYYYNRMVTIRKVHLTEVALWAIALLVGLLPFFGWSTMNIVQICNFFGIMHHGYLFFVSAIFFATFLLMLTAYTKLVLLSKKHSMEMQATEVNGRRLSLFRRTWKSVKTSFIIVGAYLLCWTPAGVFILIVLLTDSSHSFGTSPNVIFTYLLGVGLLNSIVNPIIYAREIDEFRKRLIGCCCYCPRKKNVHKRASQNSAEISLAHTRSRKSSAL